MIILIFFAFLAGIVTVLSPCILPLLPIILSSSVTGSRRPLGVILGFITSFTFFTLFISLIVNLSGVSADLLRNISVVILIVFGLTLLIPQLQIAIERMFVLFSRFTPRQSNNNGFLGGLLVGFSLGLVWTPCVGPILTSVITLAISSAITFQAFLITLAYSIGTAIPMFLVMRAGNSAMQKVPWLTRNTTAIQRVFGLVMIMTAIGIFFQVERRFQTFILDTFPEYGVILTKLESSPLVKTELEK